MRVIVEQLGLLCGDLLDRHVVGRTPPPLDERDSARVFHLAVGRTSQRTVVNEIDEVHRLAAVGRPFVMGHKEGILSLIHISEPTRLGMISYAVFCLKKKKK